MAACIGGSMAIPRAAQMVAEMGIQESRDLVELRHSLPAVAGLLEALEVPARPMAVVVAVVLHLLTGQLRALAVLAVADW